VGIRTGNGFCAAGVFDRNELVEENRVLVMVPVTENDGEFVVILMHLFRRVDYNGCAQAVDVLAL
jgi:hypothetical protein